MKGRRCRFQRGTFDAPYFLIRYDARPGAVGNGFAGLRGASGPGADSRISTDPNKAISKARTERDTGRYRRLDLAVEALYPHTDFYNMGRTFFQRTIEGNLKPEQEEKLRQLGVKL